MSYCYCDITLMLNTNSLFYALVCPLFFKEENTVGPFLCYFIFINDSPIRDHGIMKKKRQSEMIPERETKGNGNNIGTKYQTKWYHCMNKQKLGIDTLPFLWCVTVLILVLALMPFKQFKVFCFWWWYFCQMGNGQYRYVAKIAGEKKISNTNTYIQMKGLMAVSIVHCPFNSLIWTLEHFEWNAILGTRIIIVMWRLISYNMFCSPIYY